MCINPLALKSNSKFRSVAANATSFTVPCGRCLSCEYDYGDQWQLRCHQEIYECIQAGGDVVFITLTYRNSDLPYLDLLGDRIDAFDYFHIRNFIREIRRDINNMDGFRFFITGEYGDRTLRSHYHGLLFFYPSVSQLIQSYRPTFSKTQAIKDFIQEHWPYGFCRWSRSVSSGGPGIFVSNGHAGSYCSKYVAKCLGFHNMVKSAFDDALSLGMFESESEMKLELRKFRSDNYRYFCRHFQSLCFGDGILDYVDIERCPDLLVKSPFHVVRNGKELLYPVSRYQFRKKTHDFDKVSKTWQLNDYGLYCKQLRLRSLFESQYIKFVRVTSPVIYSALSGASSDLSSSFISDLRNFGLDLSRNSFSKLFYCNYLTSYELSSDLSKYIYATDFSLDTLCNFLSDSFYAPIYKVDEFDYRDSCLPCPTFSCDFPKDFLLYSDLFRRFVSLYSKITLRNVESRNMRDVKYKSFMDKLYNLNS